jgi:hypothetical protein
MKEFVPDGSTWQWRYGVYDGFFRAVLQNGNQGNLNALIDSIEAGNINAVEVPFRLIINLYGSIGPGAKKMAADFVDLIQEIGARVCPVEIITEK